MYPAASVSPTPSRTPEQRINCVTYKHWHNAEGNMQPLVTLVFPIWYVAGSKPIFFSSSSEMSSLKDLVSFGSKTLNWFTNSCKQESWCKIKNWAAGLSESLCGTEDWSKLNTQYCSGIKWRNSTVPGMCTLLRSLTSWCERFPAFLYIWAAESPRPHPDTSPSAQRQW